jgi:E3 ubiquitin-protein ligase ZNF598
MSEAPPERPRGGGRWRGQGRGRGRGGASQPLESWQGDASRGGRRRGSGASRGGAGTGVDGHRMPPAGDSNTHARLSRERAEEKREDEKKVVREKKDAEGRQDDVEAEVCFICASPVVHNSVAPCNHRTCHICALRMRALYKTKDCAHCRVCSCFLCARLEDGQKLLTE